MMTHIGSHIFILYVERSIKNKKHTKRIHVLRFDNSKGATEAVLDYILMTKYLDFAWF